MVSTWDNNFKRICQMIFKKQKIKCKKIKTKTTLEFFFKINFSPPCVTLKINKLKSNMRQPSALPETTHTHTHTQGSRRKRASERAGEEQVEEVCAIYLIKQVVSLIAAAAAAAVVSFLHSFSCAFAHSHAFN
jgi:hypothetical protein